jgi:hypothetical protein
MTLHWLTAGDRVTASDRITASHRLTTTHLLASTDGFAVAPFPGLARSGLSACPLACRPVSRPAAARTDCATGALASCAMVARVNCATGRAARVNCATGHALGRLPATVGRSAEHFGSPHDHADDQGQQRQRCQSDRHVDQAEVTGHGTRDQQAHRDRCSGHDRPEPDHLEAPLVVKRGQD